MSRMGLGQKLTIGGALLLLLCFTPVPAQSQNTALVPAPFAEGRHAEFLERARQGDIDCLLMGDSITDWWRRAGLAVYEENFGSLNCANFGIAADRTQGVLWRFANGELDGYTPRLMMLMIGTNNLRFRGPPNTPEEVSMGIAAVVTRFRAKFPEAKVLWGSSPEAPSQAHRCASPSGRSTASSPASTMASTSASWISAIGSWSPTARFPRT